MIETKFISESAEQFIIYAMLKEEDYLLKIIEVDEPDLLNHPVCRKIYTSILDAFASGKKIIKEIIYEYLSQNEINYFNNLLNKDLNLKDYDSFYSIVNNKFLLRSSKKISEDTIKQITISTKDKEPVNGTDIVSIASESFTNLLNKIPSFESKLGEDIFDIIPNPDTYNGVVKDVIGLSSGIKWLDNVCGGFNPGSYNVIGGRPSQAKSELTRNILLHNAYKGIGSLYISLDEPVDIIKLKLISTITQINYNSLEHSDLTKTDLEKLKNKLPIIKDLPFIIDSTPGLTVPLIRAKIKKAKYKYPNIKAVAIDYIQRIGGEGTTAYERTTNVSNAIKNLCFEFPDTVFFIIAQLSRSIENRATERGERWTDPPLLSDLRDSGELESAADRIIFLKAEPPKSEDGKFKELRKTRIFVLKQRAGIAGVWHDLNNKGSIQTFYEIENDYKDDLPF